MPKVVMTLDPLAGGVTLAALWAADVSTACTILLGAATLFSNDIYKRFINPAVAENKFVIINRLSVFAVEMCIRDSNSAALTELQEYQLDMVRQGITLYGLHPAHMIGCYKDFEPVMTVKTQVAFVKTLPPGETIGYGRTYTLTRPSVIATVPIGYADGVSRRLSNRGYMLVNGMKAPIIGRVCMDQTMLDVTDIPDVKLGSEVIVFGGRELPMELVAEWADTKMCIRDSSRTSMIKRGICEQHIYFCPKAQEEAKTK